MGQFKQWFEGSAMEGELEPPLHFVLVKGNVITLRGWRALTNTNLLALALSVIAVPTAGIFVGLWLAVLTIIFLAYALWTIYRRILTPIEFSKNGFTIYGEEYSALQYGPFLRREILEGLGPDDTPGWLEILVQQKDGQPVLLATMTRHADGERIVALLNARLASA